MPISTTCTSISFRLRIITSVSLSKPIHSFILISLRHISIHYYTHDSCYLLSCSVYLQFIAIFYQSYLYQQCNKRYLPTPLTSHLLSVNLILLIASSDYHCIINSLRADATLSQNDTSLFLVLSIITSYHS